MQWELAHILEATGGQLLCGPPALNWAGISIDSRSIGPDQLFVAIRGERHDGHDFVSQVVSAGVRGVVVARDAIGGLDLDRLRAAGAACVAVEDTVRALGALAARRRRLAGIPLVAITGSNGKTSTRQMTALVVGRRMATLSTTGNLNNEIGVPLTLFQLKEHHQAAVIEMGMNHPGEIDRLAAICQPDIGVITNVAPAHLEFMQTIEGVARAKGELLAHIRPRGTAVLNRDDPHVSALARGFQGRVLFFGTAPDAAVRAENIHEKDSGVAFDMILPGDRIDVRLSTPGRFMVANALAAAASGHLLGVSAADIKDGLEAFAPVKGRLNLVSTARGVNLIDDTYNANPASMAAALETLARRKGSRPGYCVLGDMLELGPAAPDLHRQVGRLAAACKPSRLYLFGPNAQAAAQGAVEGGLSQDTVMIASKEAIAADLIARLRPGDWVLIKGSRGMAMETVTAALLQRADKPA